jgi:hypothetical protein
MGLLELDEDPNGLYVVATHIDPIRGELDNLFLEPASNIDDGCVALTKPMSFAEAIVELENIKHERSQDNPRWESAL